MRVGGLENPAMDLIDYSEVPDVIDISRLLEAGDPLAVLPFWLLETAENCARHSSHFISPIV